MDPVELLLHPVRLRVVHAMSGGRRLTITQLRARMADVPKASIYRHVGVLADAGVLVVDGEQRVRGAVERVYRLSRERPAIDAEAAAAMTTDEHRRGFTAAMAALLAEFNAHLDRGADGAAIAESVSYRQAVLWLTEQERAELVDRIRGAVLAVLGNVPRADRVPHLLATVLFPTEQPLAEG